MAFSIIWASADFAGWYINVLMYVCTSYVICQLEFGNTNNNNIIIIIIIIIFIIIITEIWLDPHFRNSDLKDDFFQYIHYLKFDQICIFDVMNTLGLYLADVSLNAYLVFLTSFC